MASDRFSQIWDAFEGVHAKITKDSKTIKDFTSFLQKRAEIEEMYAKSLKKLAQAFAKSDNLGESTTLGASLEALKEEADKTGEAHLNFSRAVAMEEKEVQQWAKTTGKTRDKALSEGVKLTKQLTNAKVSESRAKEKYYKLAREASSNDKVAKKATQADQSYSKCVNDLQGTQNRHYDQMPTILEELQVWDEGALDKIKVAIDAIVGQIVALPTSISEIANYTQDVTLRFDRSNDMQNFVYGLQTESQPRPELVGYVPFDGEVSSYSAPSTASSARSSIVPSFFRGSTDGNIPVAKAGPAASRASRVSRLFNSPPQLQGEQETGGAESDENYVGPVNWTCEAMYDWQASESEGELSLSAGDALTVTYRHEGGWLNGSNAQGKTGNFPENYVTFS